MNIAIDLGNSTSHVYLYKDRQLLQRRIIHGRIEYEKMKEIMYETSGYNHIIISSVIGQPAHIMELLKIMAASVLWFDHTTPLPIENLYRTPDTLGMDRLADAVGAAALYPGENVLIIDAGTCIKYDFVNSKGQYLGGSISPGLQMRLDAMHKFTAKLPQLKAREVIFGIGNGTESAMQSGAYRGAILEMEGFAKQYGQNYSNLKCILTGGDSRHFANALNFPIFAQPDLTGIGLNEILLYNLHKRQPE